MKTTRMPLTITLCLILCACGSNSPGSVQSGTPTPAPKEVLQPADLTGDLKQKNSESNDAYQAATIDGETITINWVTNNEDTKSLYWVGSFEAPTSGAESHSWTSKRDQEATESAMLASGDETKKFTYENGEISYEAGIMGTTTTVRLSKTE